MLKLSQSVPWCYKSRESVFLNFWFCQDLSFFFSAKTPKTVVFERAGLLLHSNNLFRSQDMLEWFCYIVQNFLKWRKTLGYTEPRANILGVLFFSVAFAIALTKGSNPEQKRIVTQWFEVSYIFYLLNFTNFNLGL